MHKKWIISERIKDDIILDILEKRGVKNPESFLNPNYDKGRHNPAMLPNIDKAIEIINDAIERKLHVGVFGDYDADGIPGTALLYRGLTKIGLRVTTHIPRREDGYGLSQVGIDKLRQLGVDILITVDNGTTATREVEYANNQGMRVIVLDHHEQQEQLPDAVIVNPKLISSSYPFSEICATVVVHKFLEMLSKTHPEIGESWLKWQLDLVALATVCDVVPLIDENRVLTHFGLLVMKKSRNRGIQALAQVAGINLSNINSYDVGFILGPRINAPGRVLADPEDVYKLLITEDRAKAREIANLLNDHNSNRQNDLLVAVILAEQKVTDGNLLDHSVIIVSSADWGIGLVGLIAARIMEKYHRPVFCFREEENIFKGSARSLPGYELPTLLQKVNKFIDKWGGHNFAAGLSVDKKNFSQFCDRTILLFDGLSSKNQTKVLQLDSSITIAEINQKLIGSLEKLQPHGFGNPRPLFYLGDVELDRVSKMGSDGKHSRGVVKQKGEAIAFVGFGISDIVEKEKKQSGLEIVATLRENIWMGNSTIQLDIKDIRKKVNS